MQKKARKSKRAKFWKSLFIFLILLAVWSIIADIIVIFWGESYPRETGFFINAVKYSIFFLFAKSLIKLNAYSFKKIMGSFSIRKADKSALAYEKIGNLTPNEQRSAQWGKFIFFSLGQDLGARH